MPRPILIVACVFENNVLCGYIIHIFSNLLRNYSICRKVVNKTVVFINDFQMPVFFFHDEV